MADVPEYWDKILTPKNLGTIINYSQKKILKNRFKIIHYCTYFSGVSPIKFNKKNPKLLIFL